MNILRVIGEVAVWFIPTVTVIAAVVRYYWNSKAEHAKMMLELIREFQREHIETFYALVERKDNEFYRGNLNFDTTENERKADALLLFLENILHLHANGTISVNEFIHFEYYLKRVIGDPDFVRYLHDFGVTCSDDGTVNPFSRVLDYCRSQSAFKSMNNENVPKSSPAVKMVDEDDAKAASEEAFITYLTLYYQAMTRTAKAVKSRVDSYLPKRGWSYDHAPTKDELLTTITTISAEVSNPDSAASIRAALRQYYRASFGEEPLV